MSNGRMKEHEIEAILSGDQESVNRFLVASVCEMRDMLREVLGAPGGSCKSGRRGDVRTWIMWTLGTKVGSALMSSSIGAAVALFVAWLVTRGG